MARPELRNEHIEKMGREKPGSADESLRAKREELAAERRAELERADYERFVRSFVFADGTEAAAMASYGCRAPLQAILGP